ncbi:MAG TPA: hypothetical protein DCL74_03430 [Succinivibrionaceae bacterium]|nr:hypothetical protein [Succinivibrionaceae bacterium]
MEGKLQLFIDFYKKPSDEQSKKTEPVLQQQPFTEDQDKEEIRKKVNGLKPQSGLFAPDEIYDFEFEEKLSVGFRGTVKIKRKTQLNLMSADLDETLVRVFTGIKGVDSKVSQRWIWALIDSISYEGKVAFKNQKGDSELFCVYLLKLISPLAKLKGYYGRRSFVDKSAAEILKAIFSGYGKSEGRSTDTYNSSSDQNSENIKFHGLNFFPADFFAPDFSKISDSNGLKELSLTLQQGEESDLDFFNRLLIACGINFTFVHKRDCCSLVFSETVNFVQNKDCPQVTAEINKKTDLTEFELLDELRYSKKGNSKQNAQAHAEAFYSTLLGGECASFNYNGGMDLVRAQIKRNLERRNGRNNIVFSAKIQNVSCYPGCVLNIAHFECGKQILIERSLLHVNTLADTVYPLLHQLWGLVLDDSELIHETSKENSKSDLSQRSDRLGSFAPDPEQIAPVLSLHSAVVCDALGNIEETVIGSNSDLATKNIEERQQKTKTVCTFAHMFYARLQPEDNIVMVKVLPGSEFSRQHIPPVGTKILLLLSGGVFFMYSYRQDDFCGETDNANVVSSAVVTDVFAKSRNSKLSINTGIKGTDSDKNRKDYEGEASIVLSRYNNVIEYIAEKIKRSSTDVERCMAWLGVISNRTFITETYLEKYENKVDDVHNRYIKLKHSLNAALQSFSNARKKIDLSLNDPEIHGQDGQNTYESKILSLKSEYRLDDLRKKYKQINDEINKLAKDIVNELKLTQLKQSGGQRFLFGESSTYSELDITSNNDVTVFAENELKLQGKRIVLTADDIEINANNSIKLYSENGISQSVKAASISLKGDGATIFGPGTYSGYDVKQNATYNTANMFSSTFSVKGYNGISGSAFNISFGASNNLALKGSLGTGMNFGYGAISMTSERFNYISEGRRDLIANMAKFGIEFGTDLALSLGATNKADVTIKNVVINTVNTIYDDVITGIDKSQIINKKVGATGKEGVTGGQKACCYLESVMIAISVMLDYIYDVCKIVYSSEDADIQRKDKENGTTRPDKDKPYYLRQIDNASISKLDQTRLYINYLKIMCNLTIAGVLAAEAGGGIKKNNLTSIAINSQRYKLETPLLEGLAREEQKDNSPAAGEENPKKEYQNDKEKKKEPEKVQDEVNNDPGDDQVQHKQEANDKNAEEENSDPHVQGGQEQQQIGQDLQDSQDQQNNGKDNVVNPGEKDAVKENSGAHDQGDNAKQIEQDPPEQVVQGQQVNQEQHAQGQQDSQVK